MRQRMSASQWNVCEQGRALLWFGHDAQRPAEGVEPFSDADQAEPLRGTVGREAAPVVVHAAAHPGRRELQLDGGAARVRVLDGVVQRLLHDPVQRGLDARGQALLRLRGHRDRQPGALGDLLRQEFERGDQPQVVEHGRPQLVRQVAQLPVDSAQQLLDLVEALARGGRQVAGDVGQQDVHRGQQLAGLVVQGMGDALDLALEDVVEVPQRAGAFLRAAMAHLERRQALGEECLGGREPALWVRSLPCDAAQRMVMDRRQLERAAAVDQRAARQVVAAAQHRLAAVLQVGLQQVLVTLGQLARVHRAQRSPLVQTTSTAASSVRLAYRPRRLSARAWGSITTGSSSSGYSPMPSVVRISVSLSDTVRTSGVSSGRRSPTTPPYRISSRVRRRVRSVLTSVPATLPTPTQVRLRRGTSKRAMLTAAPRVPRKAAWQRAIRSTGFSRACFDRTWAARSAARAASRPCPSASIIAIIAPPSKVSTTYRSPHSLSPGSGCVAAPHSKARALITVAT